MKRPSRKIAFRILYLAFGIRLVGCLIRAFGEIVEPHVWRQTDTLGMSLRYWLRFIHEPFNWKLLLPAVLQSGDGNGILPVEFPFLNFIFSPAWALGPYWGKVVIYVLLSLLIFYICKKISETKHWLSPAFLLLPFLSISADYIEKFIPDTLATLLVSYGALLFIKDRRKWALALVTLGILMKPTSIVALGILFLFSKFRKRFVSNSLFFALPTVVGLIYYTVGLKWIDHFRQGDVLIFLVAARNPIQSLHEIFSNLPFVLGAFQNRVFFVWGGLFVLLCLAFLRLKPKLRILGGLCGLLFLQFTVIAALDGGHSAQHDYYYMGMAPIAAAVVWLCLRKGRPALSALLLTILFLHSVELSAQNLNPKKLTGFFRSRQECSMLKQRNPMVPWNQDYVFRSRTEPFPALGLCFGEREGSKTSNFGIYFKTDTVPDECRTIDQTEQFKLVKCGG